MEIKFYKDDMKLFLLTGLCCILFLLSGFSTALCQNNTVSGIVTDAKTGEPLAGVNILVINTTSGTFTDSTGHYSLTLPTKKDTLRFSFIGYKTRRVPIKGRKTIDVELFQTIATANKNLVVVGYGKEKTEAITGSIASIKGPQLTKSPAPNLKVALAGKLPGLTVIQSSGQPGYDHTHLFIRGRSSVNGQNPLILVDGVEQKSISNIDPTSVADITILKDASATAVYGIRGANGVILITTKRGHKGKPTVSLSARYGLQSFTQKAPVIYNSYEWAKLKNQASRASGGPSIYSNYDLQQYKKHGKNPLYPEINWRKLMLKEFAPIQHYNFSFSGGAAGGKVLYFVDANFLHQKGQFKTNQKKYNANYYLRRYNFRSNIDAFLSPTTHVYLNLSGVVGDKNSPSQLAPYRLLSYLNASTPNQLGGVLTPEGHVIANPKVTHPPVYGKVNRSGFNRNLVSSTIASLGIKQNLSSFLKGLEFELRASFNTHAIHGIDGNKSFSQWVALRDPSDSTNIIYRKEKGKDTPLSLSNAYSFRTRSEFLGKVNYDQTFGKHHVTALLIGMKRKTFKPGFKPIPFNLLGISTRETYDYNDKYFFEFDAAYNGSEQFEKGKRFGFFPSFSAGWLISNENFLKYNSTISHLKIRGSYGLVGSDKLGNQRFLYQSKINLGGNVYSSSLMGSINESFIGNPNLTWEVNHMADIGFEIGFLNKLNFNVDIFKEHRTNVLISGASTAPILNGLPLGALSPINTGIIDNKGYEIVATYNSVLNTNFSIKSQINFDYAKNTIVDLNEPKRRGGYAYPFHEQGFSIGQPFGYVIDHSINGGYFKNQKQINKYPTYAGMPAPRPGDFVYKDLNGDGIINEKDIGPIGYPSIPLYNFGASVSIKWKSFDFSILFQGVADVSNDPREFGYTVQDQHTFFKWHKYAWTPKRQAKGKPISYPRLQIGANSSSTQTNDFWIEPSGFLRLKNVDIGYTLPVHWTKVIDAKEIRFYVNSTNTVLIWNNLTFKGYDPELTGHGALTYPIYRTFTFGVNVKF
jgi:TonB-linked SusC/RagA family outer membrane protein